MTYAKGEEWKEIFLSQPRFESTNAFQKLQELVKRAPVLSKAGVLTEERVVALRATGVGYTVLYGFQRVDAQIMMALQELCVERKVFDQMQALFAGRKVNFIEGIDCENRSVLHPATRDIFGDELTGDVGARGEVEKEIQKLRTFFPEGNSPYTHLVFIGIGGSELGPHAIADSLAPYHIQGRSVSYIANVDPDEMTAVLKGLDLKKTLVAVVSKSGTTLETETNEARIRQAFLQEKIDPREHFVAVTCPKTPMDDLNKYKEVFHLFDWVGGRFSATSVVGGVLISFLCGTACFSEFLKGANEMDRVALFTNIRDNIPLLLAALSVWNRNFLGYPTEAVIPYACSLRGFPGHLQQCGMESNGKSIDRFGRRVSFVTSPVVWGEVGTNAQHSFFQLLHQGTDVVPLEFIGFKESQFSDDYTYHGTTSHEKLIANLFGQVISLATGKDNENSNKYFPGNRPSTVILGVRLDAFAVGALLSMYEHKIAFEGFIWGINSFDQEGVQLGKNLSFDILEIIRARHEGGEDFTANPIARRLLDILDDVGHPL